MMYVMIKELITSQSIKSITKQTSSLQGCVEGEFSLLKGGVLKLGGISMEKSYYEVIKFIDHDSSSRITMDYVQGELLVDKVKNTSELSKEMIFSWFYNLLIQMIQYHKCCNNRIYRYLNPYSVVIVGDREVYLLDIDSSSNSFVIKNLQTPSMREHFLKAKIQQTEENQIGYDIYCFGKTLQYILACSESYISLSKAEDNKCFNLIERCIHREARRKYMSFIQMKKDFSFTNIKKGKLHVSNSKGFKIVLGVVIVVIVANIIFAMGLSFVFPKGSGETNKGNEQEVLTDLEQEGGMEDGKDDGVGINDEGVKGDSVEGDGFQGDVVRNVDLEGDSIERGLEWDLAEITGINGTGRLEGSSGGDTAMTDKGEGNLGESSSLESFLKNLEEDVNRLVGYLHNNDREDNERIIFYGEEMEITIIRVLAMAYDREGYKEQGILAYGRQIAIENREEHLERAIIRKMRLEEELGWITQGIETGKDGLEMLGDNIDVGRLYLELMISSDLFNKEEVRKEYERLLTFIKELEGDGIGGRIERME